MQIDLSKHLNYEPPPPAIPFQMDERTLNDKRRKPQSAKTAQFEPKKIWQMHHEIINLHVLGWKNTDIAKKIGATKEHISSIVNSSAAKAKISLLRGERDAKVFDTLKEVEKLLPQAVETYERILSGQEGTVQLKKSVADTIIKDICGYQAPKKFQTASVHLTPSDLEEFKTRGIQAAIEAGIILDAEYEEG